MKKSLFALLLTSLFLGCSCSRQDGLSWRRVSMDGSRTGVTPIGVDNIPSTLGTIDSLNYHAPSGRTFEKGSATYAAASLLLAAQPAMSDVKTVLAHSTREMMRHDYPESALGDWYIDLLMREVERLAGKKVHFAITNFGGIRVDMPAGEVLKDDILSMFPFKNKLCYLELEGRDIRALLEQLAAGRWQVVGGARCVVEDGCLVSVIIDGEPLEDDRVYGVATISFLLDGGDDLHVARNAKKLEILPYYIIDVVLPYVESLEAQGKPIEYEKDGRIIIRKKDE